MAIACHISAQPSCLSRFSAGCDVRSSDTAPTKTWAYKLEWGPTLAFGNTLTWRTWGGWNKCNTVYNLAAATPYYLRAAVNDVPDGSGNWVYSSTIIITTLAAQSEFYVHVNGDGLLSQFSRCYPYIAPPFPGAHWPYVLDPTNDKYLYETLNGTSQSYDYYTVQDPSTIHGPMIVNSVSLNYVFRRGQLLNHSVGFYKAGNLQIIYSELGGSVTQLTEYYRTVTSVINPFTGLPWTFADFIGLQIVVYGKKEYSGQLGFVYVEIGVNAVTPLLLPNIRTETPMVTALNTIFQLSLLHDGNDPAGCTCGFEYWREDDPTINTITEAGVYYSGSILSRTLVLSPGIYWVRAFATNVVGTNYGIAHAFTVVTNVNTLSLPSVSTVAATEIG